MPFLINGSTASIVPSKQFWQLPVVLGQNLDQETIYSSRRSVLLEFDSCPATLYKQWEDVVNGGSLFTLTILQPDTIAYTGYSNVYVKWQTVPQFQSGYVVGPWSILAYDILP